MRRIYLVTDDQIPHWLDTQHPRLTIVTHKELFGDRAADALPVFSSPSIETQLHNIPGARADERARARERERGGDASDWHATRRASAPFRPH